MDATALVEVNLVPVPKGGAFTGFIEIPSQVMTYPLENTPISIFNPACTLTNSIQPGDMVLCQESTPLCTGIIHFYSPLRTFTRGDELFAFIQQNPEIPIRAWDHGEFIVAVQHLIKLSEYFKENSNVRLIPDILKVLITVIWEGRESFVFPKLKHELLGKVRSSYNDSEIRQYLEKMSPDEIATFSAKDWVEILVPFLRDVAWWYNPTPEVSAKINEVLTKTDKLKHLTSIRDIFLKDFQTWALAFNPFDLEFHNVIAAHPEMVKVRATIFDAYILPLRNATMFIRGRKYKRFWVRSLRRSFLGNKLLEDIHVPRGRDWVDAPTFNLIHAALRQINVNIAPQKYSRRSFWSQRSQR